MKLKGGSDGFEEACKSDKVEVLKHWIRSGGMVPKNPKHSCINMACLLGNFGMVKLLVENGVDLSDPNQNNATLGNICGYQLEYACFIENIELVKTILEYYDGLGVLERKDKINTKKRKRVQDFDCLDHENTGKLEEYKITKTLLEKGENIQNSDLLNGVKIAIEMDNIKTLKILLAYKIDFCNHSEVLIAVIGNKNIDMIKLLLKNGLNVKTNKYIINLALGTKNFEIIRLLLEHGVQVDKDSDYLDCLITGDIKILKLVLSYRPYIGGSSRLLETAIELNKLEAVKLLLKDTTSLKDSKYNHVLQACKRNNTEMLKMLLEKGARLTRGRKSGVIQACENNNLKMLKLLFENNARLLKKDYGLREACYHRNLELIKLLLKYGADISRHIGSIMKIAKDLDDHELIEFCQNKGSGNLELG
ncbi:putative ankyrin repeat protein [Zancudomyces culisetae]|uniref:Putative ankyrin repeat protein n=1 Tax=Zancudomyces culisetae TaxID=1213189 RepID=A0A1R1PCB5_ZANCU|nr:putative ankyrin repeat protein [Zancudomyces culisetae]|eukprot:OMH78604.1 putative ankyrin repeat protein [Zancudomyces culisetae]